MTAPHYAISLKQPWAALVVAGLKTIEIRTWPTNRLGPILIHASKTIDERADSWKHITTPELKRLAGLLGGIVGSVELLDCIEYDSADSFAAATSHHYNEASWFKPPKMYGFSFGNAKVLPFRKLPGNTNFFPVNARWRVVAPPERGKAGKDALDE